MNVCFCFNNLGALGLGATITSLLLHCSDNSKLKLYFFCASVNKNLKRIIISLLKEKKFTGSFEFIEFNPEVIFKPYRALQGDRTTYGRLLIPDLLNCSQILYIDTDIIVEVDVLKLNDVDMRDFSIGAVNATPVQFALEHKFFINTLHINPSFIVFNAGVLLINISNWQKYGIKEKLFSIADAYPQELLSADQTLLNALFANNFFLLPSNYNVHCYASKGYNANQKAIYHFVGSPKPWDIFGNFFHKGYDKWKEYNPNGWVESLLKNHLVAQLRRTWSIRRSYLKLLLRK